MAATRRDKAMDEVWREGWYGIRDDPAMMAGLAAELRAELAPGHWLEAQAWEVIGRRDARDDVLVLLADGRVAEVHLTWAQHPEPPPFPRLGTFASFAEWAALPD